MTAPEILDSQPAAVLDRRDPDPAGGLRLSIVAPCFNEESVLPEFIARMDAAAQAAAGEAYEVILINDGSRDNSWACIRALAIASPRVVGVNLSRNYGHQLAATAGLEAAKGARVLLIDADLQDPPELIGAMMALMDEGYDVVYGRREAREGESMFKLATAKLFYRLLNAVSEVKIPRDVGDFRLMSRRMVDRLNAMPEQDRFLRGMVAWLGGRQTEITYRRDRRRGGGSSYTLARMIRLAVDGLAGFSMFPLRLAAIFAATGAGLGVLIAAYALIGFVAGRAATGWTSLALITIFFGTAQLGCLAIFGAYLGRIHNQVRGRPLFVVEEIVGGGAPDRAGAS